MIDFHSHVLPGMDDGSKSVEQSLDMLAESYRQGVEHMCATSHYYAHDESPNDFLLRRRKAYDKLLPYLNDTMPQIHLGAEVLYFEGICSVQDIDRLKLEGTDILLLEMPFTEWTDRIWRDVEELASLKNTRVMLAHIERYFQFGAKRYLTNILDSSIIIQSNAEFFLTGYLERQRAFKLLKRGIINVLGSDCHNMTSRPQKLQEAREQILKHAGRACLDEIDSIGYMALNLRG